MSETILITGFEPFGGIACNPTMDIVAALHGDRVDGRQVVGRILPVVYEGHRERLRSLMDEVDPTVMIGFGLDVDATGIQIETRGVNLADFNLADNAGIFVKNVRLENCGLAFRQSTLPVEDIHAALDEAHIPSTLSIDAGRYLCNATLYHLLELATRKPQPPRCGFIHVPQACEHLADRLPDTEKTSRGPIENMLDLDTMIDAARIILREASIAARNDHATLRPRDWQDDSASKFAVR